MNLSDEIYLDDDNRKDTSYTKDKGDPVIIDVLRLVFPQHYSLDDMRDAYVNGKKIGFEMGMDRGGVFGRTMELQQNLQDNNEKQFYEDFLKLCEKHNIRITYHPTKGLCFTNLR